MSKIENHSAHAPTKWLPGSVPGYRPTAEGAPQLPNRPRLPHVPHFKHAGRVAALGLAGALTFTAVEGFIRPQGTSDPIVRAGEIPAEQMRYPWDSGNVHLELKYEDLGERSLQFLGVEITSEPAIVNIGEGKYIKYVLGQEYGEPDNALGHVRIDLIDDAMKGGVWEKSVDAQGNTILNTEGKPILHPFGYQEPVPGQAGQA